MLQYPRARLACPLAALALVLAGACSGSESPRTAEASAATPSSAAASPAASPRVSSSAGDVVATGATSLIDSISTIADKARIRGAATAPVWLVEISDFQCPFCKEWHDKTFATIDREYVKTGKVRLAYLNFPLSR